MDSATLNAARSRAITISLTAGVLILALKFGAWLLTGSAALLSDALESIVNVAASAFAMWSIRVAGEPPDADHPYGHGKAEYFSALAEGALIAVAAVLIIHTGVSRVLDPKPLTSLDAGLAVSVLASAGNLLLGLFLVRAGRATDSIALEADGRHVLTDVYTTGGVLLGLATVRFTGWLWLDGAIACVVALGILRTAYSLVTRAVQGLMQQADHGLLEDIRAALEEFRHPSWVSVHGLRAWRSGGFVHVDFHLVLPRSMPFEDVDAQVKRLEKLFAERYHGRADVLVKPEICEQQGCTGGFAITTSGPDPDGP